MASVATKCGLTLILLIVYYHLPVLCRCPPNNIIMLMVDDLKPALGSYGNPLVHTPNMDRLLAMSTQFHNAHAQFALCGPSRTSLLTSRRPNTLTVFDQHLPYWRDLPGNFTSLPQYFKESSYHTTSLGKIFHPSKLSGMNDDYPYSWTDLPYHPSTHAYKNAKVCPGEDGQLYANIVCPVDVSKQPGGTLPDLQTAGEAVKKLKKLSSRKTPFFLAVGFHKPHIPLKYPKQYNKLYNLSDIVLPVDNTKPCGLPNIAWNPFMDVKSRDDVARFNISFPYGRIPGEFQKHLIRSYYAATSYADDMIGQVLSAVEENKLWNNTIIALLADHGWSLGEHGEWSKFSNYDIATRVPLGIYVPPVSTPSKPSVSHVYDMVELVDLFPTLVELAGLEPLKTCPDRVTTTCTEGKSLVPFMRGERVKSAHNVSYTQYPRPSIQPQVNSDQPNREDIRYMGYAVKSTQYRYVGWVPFNVTSMTSNLTNVVAEELYDLYTDPREDHNLIDSLPAVRRQLYKLLLNADWMKF